MQNRRTSSFSSTRHTHTHTHTQERKRVQQVSSGIVNDEDGLPAVQIIPPILQLYPEVEVEHADDTGGLVHRARCGKWTWLFAGRTVYLVAPMDEGTSGAVHQEIRDSSSAYSLRILHSRDIAPLLQAYLKETGAQHA
jgi:hypothetical protein